MKSARMIADGASIAAPRPVSFHVQERCAPVATKETVSDPLHHGVFAAGDCTTVPFKQFVVPMGAGSTAMLSGESALAEQRRKLTGRGESTLVAYSQFLDETCHDTRPSSVTGRR